MTLRSWLVSCPLLALACGATPVPGGAVAPPAAAVLPGAPDAAAATTEADSGAPNPSAPEAGAVASATTPPAIDPIPPRPPTAVMEDPSGCTPVAAAFEREARPKIKECYREGKKADANLEGTVKLLLSVDARGKKTIKTEDVTLPESVAKCMVKVLQDTPFPEGKKCLNKGLIFPIKFPSR